MTVGKMQIRDTMQEINRLVYTLSPSRIIYKLTEGEIKIEDGE